MPRREVPSHAGWQGECSHRVAANPEGVVHHRGAHTNGGPVMAAVNACGGGHRPPTHKFSVVIQAELQRRAVI